jgi:hypothetical protein
MTDERFLGEVLASGGLPADEVTIELLVEAVEAVSAMTTPAQREVFCLEQQFAAPSWSEYSHVLMWSADLAMNPNLLPWLRVALRNAQPAA